VGTSATVGTTLGVTGLSTLTGGFDSNANSTVTGTFGVVGATSITGGTGTLSVAQLSTLTGGFNAGASSSIVNNLTLTGTGNVVAAGDVAINGGDLTSTAATLNLNSGGIINMQDRLTMGSPNAAGADNWASWTAGWNCSYLGSCDFRHLQADELHVRLFIAELQEAHNGAEAWVKSSAILDTAFVCPAVSAGTVSIRVRDFPSAGNMRVFSTGDWVLFKTMTRTDTDTAAPGDAANDGKTELQVGECVGTVSAYVDGTTTTEGTQQWTFTRGTINTTGGSFTGTVPAEALALDFGVSGAGFLEATVNDGLEGVWGPYFQSVKWTGSPASAAAGKTVTTRFGKLTGITTTADEYGFIAGLYGSNELGRYVKASNLGVDLHGVDFTLWDGTNQAIILRRGAGSAPYIGVGGPAPTTYGGAVKGVWMGDDAGTYKLRIGDPAGPRITWDGTTLNVVGVITVTGTGSNVLPDTTTYAASTSVAGPATNTNAVGGTPAATVNSGVSKANLGLNASGNVILAINGSSLSGAAATGLNMTSTHMGYYTPGGANGGWPVLIQNNGTFYAGNGGNYVSFDGTSVTFAGNGAGVTNINGGNITTGSVNADKVTVGFSTDNMILNGNFEEGGAGWRCVESTTGCLPVNTMTPGGWHISGSGYEGAATAAVAYPPTAGYGVAIGSRAVPVDERSSYFVRVTIYSSVSSSAGLYIRMNQADSSIATPMWLGNGGEAGVTNRTNLFDLIANGAANGGWTTHELVYTPTAGTKYATLAIYNWTCVSGSACGYFLVDGVQMVKRTGNLSALSASVGTLDVFTGGYIRTGGIATGAGSGNGFWLGSNGNTPQFYIGNWNGTTGSYLWWNGSNLALKGDMLNPGIWSLTQTAGLTFSGTCVSPCPAQGVNWPNGSISEVNSELLLQGNSANGVKLLSGSTDIQVQEGTITLRRASPALPLAVNFTAPAHVNLSLNAVSATTDTSQADTYGFAVFSPGNVIQNYTGGKDRDVQYTFPMPAAGSPPVLNDFGDFGVCTIRYRNGLFIDVISCP
jgi:hypothetical protein